MTVSTTDCYAHTYRDTVSFEVVETLSNRHWQKQWRAPESTSINGLYATNTKTHKEWITYLPQIL